MRGASWLRSARHPALALVAGALHTASFSPSPAWWLQPLALAWLFWACAAARPRRAAVTGALFGTGWLASGLWWLYISMHDFGHLPVVVSAASVLLLALFLSLYYALAMGLAARVAGVDTAPGPSITPVGPIRRMLAFAGLWLGAELARATLFTGFPWIASGYAHAQGPLAALAPYVGVYGITAVAALIAAALAMRRWPLLIALVAAVGGAHLLPREFTHATGTLTVSLVQPNIPQDQKFDRARFEDNFDRLISLIDSARGQVVITPESVLPLPLAYLEDEQVQRLTRDARVRPLLLGTFLGNERDGFVNSLVGLGFDQSYDYGKRHLLPFGEFIPPGFRWFVRAMNIPMDDQGSGTHQRALPFAGQRLRPLICYEDLFGEDVVASALDHGDPAATVLVNASNLAWFGPRMVQDQHLQFSQMRALEFQRPIVRATNTGATAQVDHRGRVVARLPAEQAGVLEVTVEGRAGVTPYARWLSALGLWPLWGLVALLIVPAVLARRTGRKAGRRPGDPRAA
ncbi:MAG: apolipoprotein N-acyltransferase [Mitsuaria chitosanitabida]|uniref:apolipoprotein N-acyltransferase n=1 Tax=Roseateles chitosanitabidus TaxID=65048 RepID=UPI001B2E179B|nr:apolipoprotein N-acyltransferase [Roseateles chitosanitabidus]MBO9685807.1 apolipoprotein N-acyltransferase [Roseateles chitosanitabidus]